MYMALARHPKFAEPADNSDVFYQDVPLFVKQQSVDKVLHSEMTDLRYEMLN